MALGGFDGRTCAAPRLCVRSIPLGTQSGCEVTLVGENSVFMRTESPGSTLLQRPGGHWRPANSKTLVDSEAMTMRRPLQKVGIQTSRHRTSAHTHKRRNINPRHAEFSRALSDESLPTECPHTRTKGSWWVLVRKAGIGKRISSGSLTHP